MTIEDSTRERLTHYNPDFSAATLEAVAEVAGWQQSFGTYQEFFEKMGIKSERKIWTPVSSAEVLDIQPEDFDETETIVYHLPMANPLDPNMIYQAATIAKANPTSRLIAVGNPSVGSAGHLQKPDQIKIREGNLAPAVDPLLRYLDGQKIDLAHHVGYSAGVDLALSAMKHGDQASTNAVLIEPASVKHRSMLGLAAAFIFSNKHLNHYVEVTGLETFKAAREDSTGLVAYTKGLLRPTNRAIARSIANGRFANNLAVAIEAQKWLNKVDVVWGSESELADDGILSNLKDLPRFDNWRMQHILRNNRLVGQYHAMANDVHLQAALVRESLTHNKLDKAA